MCCIVVSCFLACRTFYFIFQQAIEANSFYSPVLRINVGKPAQIISEAEHVLEGEVRTGGQNHFYLETQSCIIIPKEGDELEIISSTQYLTDLHVCLITCNFPTRFLIFV